MAAPAALLAALEARVRTLERRERRARRSIGGVLVFAAALAGAGVSPAFEFPDVLAARRFHIVDDRGEVVGRWVSGDAGTMRLETLAGGKVTGVLEVAAGTSAPRATAPPAAAEAAAAGAPAPANDAPALQAPAAQPSGKPAGPAAEGGKKEREPFDWLD